jgi:hypothetical protein
VNIVNLMTWKIPLVINSPIGNRGYSRPIIVNCIGANGVIAVSVYRAHKHGGRPVWCPVNHWTPDEEITFPVQVLVADGCQSREMVIRSPNANAQPVSVKPVSVAQ